MRKNYKLIKKNYMLPFSTLSAMQVDKGKMPVSNIKKQLQELTEEGEVLQDDLDSIKEAIRAASKISSGETPSGEENSCLSDLKDNYPTFFDSEGEEEGSSSLLNKVMGVKHYLRSEVSNNKKAIFKLKNQDKSKEPLVEEKESLKRKEAPTDDGQQESSKKSLTSEYIDNLPYNPFDDTGTD